MEQVTAGVVEHTWYMRPVFFVSDIQRAVAFYVGMLGFKKSGMKPVGRAQFAR